MTPATRLGSGAASAPAGGRRRSSFARGYRNRNPLVLVVALALLVPVFLGFELLFTSGVWSRVPLEYLVRKPHDDFTFVSWTVARNKQHPVAEPTIYLLGGSSARESITTDDALAQAIEDAGGPDAEVVNLGSNNQNFAQSLAVLDNVPDTPATVIVGVNLNRFTPDRDGNQRQVVGRELLLKSTSLRDYVVGESGEYRFSFTIIPGILSYVTSYLREHERHLLSGEVPRVTYRQHRYFPRHVQSVARKEEMVEQWNEERSPVYRKWLDYNMAMLDELLRRADERGIDVILLELPRNREIIGHAWDRDLLAYQPRVQQLARKYGVHYVDFNAELALKNTEFRDLSHVVGTGRTKWEARLARALAELLSPEGSRGLEVAVTP